MPHAQAGARCVYLGALTERFSYMRHAQVHEFILALPDCPGGEGTPPVAFKSFAK
jgi:hypothetical protein